VGNFHPDSSSRNLIFCAFFSLVQSPFPMTSLTLWAFFESLGVGGGVQVRRSRCLADVRRVAQGFVYSPLTAWAKNPHEPSPRFWTSQKRGEAGETDIQDSSDALMLSTHTTKSRRRPHASSPSSGNASNSVGPRPPPDLPVDCASGGSPYRRLARLPNDAW
jgi:hypothetical protein